jgi:hypothetical protein
MLVEHHNVVCAATQEIRGPDPDRVDVGGITVTPLKSAVAVARQYRDGGRAGGENVHVPVAVDVGEGGRVAAIDQIRDPRFEGAIPVSKLDGDARLDQIGEAIAIQIVEIRNRRIVAGVNNLIGLESAIPFAQQRDELRRGFISSPGRTDY